MVQSQQNVVSEYALAKIDPGGLRRVKEIIHIYTPAAREKALQLAFGVLIMFFFNLCGRTFFDHNFFCRTNPASSAHKSVTQEESST